MAVGSIKKMRNQAVEGSDLDQATRLAYQIVGGYELGKWLRYQVGGNRVDEHFVPAPKLRVEVDGIPSRAYRVSKEFLAKEKSGLMRLAAELVVVDRCASTRPEGSRPLLQITD